MFLASYLVEGVTVNEDCEKVLNALCCMLVVMILQSLHDGAEVHGICNDSVISLSENKGLSVDCILLKVQYLQMPEFSCTTCALFVLLTGTVAGS